MSIKNNISALLLGVLTVTGVAQAQTLEAIPPSVVQNVTAEVVDQDVVLTWDESSDEDGIVEDYKIYYGTDSVDQIGDEYEDEILTGNVTTYTLQGLEPGTTYYIAITAIDDEGNESENYSPEVEASLGSGGDPNDDVSPKVISAQFAGDNTIEITMSEEVVLGDEQAAFSITHMNSGDYAAIDSVSVNGSVVSIILQPGAIKLGEKYEVVASSLVQDLAGNPVASGITDTVEFTATQPEDSTCEQMPCFRQAFAQNKESELEVEYTVDYFGLVSVDYIGAFKHFSPERNGNFVLEIDIDRAISDIDESVDIGLGPINLCSYENKQSVQAFFGKVASGNVDIESLFSAFTQCDIYDEFGSFVETTQMGTEGLEIVRALIDLLVESQPGNQNQGGDPFTQFPPDIQDPFNGNNNSIDNNNLPPVEIPPVYSAAPDTIPPLDVTQPKVNLENISETKQVKLTWTKSVDLDGDIQDQIIYTKVGEGGYDQGVSIGTEINSIDFAVEENQAYEVRIVTVDTSGNESPGRIITFSTSLTKSGGGIEYVLAFVGFVLFMSFIGRLRKVQA